MSQIRDFDQQPAHHALGGKTVNEDASETRARLLLVEDHDVNQILVQAMTKRLGYESELAADGIEAVERIDQSIADNNPFDLVLMDIQMPLMDGYEATRMIRASGISGEMLPIIALTANAFGDDIRNCLAAGMQAHIAKPIDIANLDSILQQWLKPKFVEGNLPPRNEVPNCMSPDLIRRYRLRKEEALNSVASLLRKGAFTGMEIREVSDQMHKLAGTAAMFGEANLGKEARLIEEGLKHWKIVDRPQKMQLAAKRFLDAA
ncbi:response regulator [Parasphingorhabdus flavimaris]|uniref:response regulator n=1 Tax=Parasphingorhabdus flavimaris TaxID=266812 RepID=UPI00300257C9